MNRTTKIAGALLAGGSLMMLTAAPAGASTASKIRKLQHDLKVVSKREKQDRAALNGLIGCMQFVNLTQYGDPAGTFGYLYTQNVLDPTQTQATTAVDGTEAGDTGTPFLIIAPECATTTRAFGGGAGPTIVPRGHLVRIARGD